MWLNWFPNWHQLRNAWMFQKKFAKNPREIQGRFWSPSQRNGVTFHQKSQAWLNQIINTQINFIVLISLSCPVHISSVPVPLWCFCLSNLLQLYIQALSFLKHQWCNIVLKLMWNITMWQQQTMTWLFVSKSQFTAALNIKHTAATLL